MWAGSKDCRAGERARARTLKCPPSTARPGSRRPLRAVDPHPEATGRLGDPHLRLTGAREGGRELGGGRVPADQEKVDGLDAGVRCEARKGSRSSRRAAGFIMGRGALCRQAPGPVGDVQARAPPFSGCCRQRLPAPRHLGMPRARSMQLAARCAGPVNCNEHQPCRPPQAHQRAGGRLPRARAATFARPLTLSIWKLQHWWLQELAGPHIRRAARSYRPATTGSHSHAAVERGSNFAQACAGCLRAQAACTATSRLTLYGKPGSRRKLCLPSAAHHRRRWSPPPFELALLPPPALKMRSCTAFMQLAAQVHLST